MKAIMLRSYGTPDVLELTEREMPVTGAGEVRVRVKTAGVMPFDCGVRRGEMPILATMTLPLTPGNEFAGIIDAVGPDTPDWAAGDEVLGFSLLNAYAEYIVVPADQIVRKPEQMPWEAAGGFSGNAQGAHMALKALAVGPGDTVLIHGAAGGLGTIAIQLAKLWGAGKIIGTASERNHDYIRSLGAVPVSYGEGLAERVLAIAPDGADAALDLAGAEALQASLTLVRDKSRIRTMLPGKLAGKLGIPPLSVSRTAARLAELAGEYARGNIRVTIRREYPLAQAAEAHREVESGHGRGKVVLVVS